ncbi:hypothetical protein GDO86_008285 [Hymenochirus boettgeri]|uniref:Uncharacterized protein n=1 Tax=Hymenochirus boettgeri TaxID=247094 RepID=A0A8T2J2D8_9PIPI|nr:hypothetical protein GDO86_008285 [Hymenochirus boettgeri]
MWDLWRGRSKRRHLRLVDRFLLRHQIDCHKWHILPLFIYLNTSLVTILYALNVRKCLWDVISRYSIRGIMENIQTDKHYPINRCYTNTDCPLKHTNIWSRWENP